MLLFARIFVQIESKMRCINEMGVGCKVFTILRQKSRKYINLNVLFIPLWKILAYFLKWPGLELKKQLKQKRGIHCADA
jgi:hypothetical protein